MTSRRRFTHGHRLAVVGGLTAAAIVLLAAAPAGAATTIGSDLASAPGATLGCSGGCTFSQRSIPGRQVTAPTDGVIVRWRIRVGSSSSAQLVKLRVIRGTGAASTGFGSSQGEPVPAAAGIYMFDTRLPVVAGDFIAIDCCVNPFGGTFVNISAGTSDRWDPPLGDGETRAPSADDYEIMVNADIEPDGDGDGFGDETQDQCPTDASTQSECVAPETAITKGPKNKTKKKRATFEFTSSEPGSTFECAFDFQSFSPCTSPLTQKAKNGKHTFAVRAKDAAGNIDPTPATFGWKVKKKKSK